MVVKWKLLRTAQERLLRQMEKHTHEQASFLFLYNPIQFFAANKTVAFVPYVTTWLKLDTISATEQHWSVRRKLITLPLILSRLIHPRKKCKIGRT